MAKEIERKFLVLNDVYKTLAIRHHDIRQGYLSRNPQATVRIRILDDKAFITVKGKNVGSVRSEWEYEVPAADATEMLELCEGSVIQKTRWIVDFGGHSWEIDEFHGDRTGLTVAEVELDSPDEEVPVPSFVGEEVTGDIRYYNSNL